MKPYVPFEGQPIHIMFDGSVDPSGAPILRKGDIYTLTGNVSSDSDGIVIERDNATLDGAGNTVQGNYNETGLNLTNTSNVMIRNANVNDFRGCARTCGNIVVNSAVSLIGENQSTTIIDGEGFAGIWVRSTGVKVSNFNIRDACFGIEVDSNSNIISQNIVLDTNYGIVIEDGSANCIVTGNIASENFEGVAIWDSYNNTIQGNLVTNNEMGIYLARSSNNSLWSNNMTNNRFNLDVDGKDLVDFINDVDISNTVNGKPVYYWINQNNKQISSDAGYVAIINSTNISVKNLSLTNNGEGILLVFTFNSTIENINVSNNDYGVYLRFSEGNLLSNNIILNNEYHGIFLFGSNNNIIEANIIEGNGYGVWLSPSWGSNGNTFYNNNFVNNTNQVGAYLNDFGINIWDDGYPYGGNYWSDYNGTDSNGDGIGETPHVIDANNIDNYPLINPLASPDIAVTNLIVSKTVIGQGCISSVNVTLENGGNKIEAFNTTVYANSTAIHSEQIVLAMTNSTLSSMWNTTGLAYGNYTISACADHCQER